MLPKKSKMNFDPSNIIHGIAYALLVITVLLAIYGGIRLLENFREIN